MNNNSTNIDAGAQTLTDFTPILPFFHPLPLHEYDVLVIDPPWPFKTWSKAGQKKSAEAHYRVMSLDAIKALPVCELLKRDGAVVYLWATGAMLPHAFEAMAAWEVIYKSSLVWRKVTASGRVRWGCGFWARSMHEHILLGTIGKPRCFALPSLFDGIAREHSRKPDEFYRLVVDRAPGLRRADVFAREKREGWDCWGDEVGKFSSGATTRERGITLLSVEEQWR